MTTPTPDRLFWLDIETTGLDPAMYDLLEVAAVVTTAANLEPLDEFHTVVRPWDMTLPGMPDVVRDMHTKSGLLADLKHGLPDPEAEDQFANFVAAHEGAYLAGSGVHFDRAFLNHHWPGALRPLHYRHLDVSTLRTFAKLYQIGVVYEQRSTHRAMDDVQDAIAELHHYQAALTGDTVPHAGHVI